jgi:hypothetical protein
MSNQLYFITHFDGIKNSSFILSQNNMNEFLKQNNLCEDLIIQGKLDLLHHQFDQTEKTENAVLHSGLKLIIDGYILYYIGKLLLYIIRRLIKMAQK